MVNNLICIFLVASIVKVFNVECCIEEERRALLEIKAYLKPYTDVNDAFDSGRTGDDCCAWSVVRCNPRTRQVTGLDLSYMASFDGNMTSPWLFNVTLFRPLKHLSSLNLSGNNINGLVEKDGSTRISTLKNLRKLKLDDNSLGTGNISVGALVSLQELSLAACGVDESILPGQELANLTQLQVLDMSYNQYKHSLKEFWPCTLKKLEKLTLCNNYFSGGLPACLQNLTSLQVLDLSANNLSDNVLPDMLQKLNMLTYLDLSDNKIEGRLSLLPLAKFSNLKVLRLSRNRLEVQTHDNLWQPTFQLQSVGLERCMLNKPQGTTPTFLLNQYNLSDINLAHNDLVGSFPNWLLSNNSMLTSLDLTNNSLTGSLELPHSARSSLGILAISQNKLEGNLPEHIGFIFPKLTNLNMSKNDFKGQIPSSISRMGGLTYLDLSNNNLSGELPRKLLSDCSSLEYLQLSDNDLQGEIMPDDMNLPSLFFLKVSNNNFGGMINDVLKLSASLFYFDISNNQITGKLPRWFGNFSWLNILSTSNNFLSGQIPSEICNLRLAFLDLSQNHFTGSIPSCSNFSSLYYLHLHKNSFRGPIPAALQNCSELATLDLRENQFSGGIPQWINKLSNLRVLLLGRNNLHGQIPRFICYLSNVNILDLSDNSLSGGIPPCLGNVSFGLKAVNESDPSSLNLIWLGVLSPNEYYTIQKEVEVQAKNQYLTYTDGNHLLMSGLDLSSNRLSGIIPSELGELQHIHSMNLSHNLLSGSIPDSFSNLDKVESLDLSFNNLNGTIPSQLINLNFLEVFNASYNNLTGRVPKTGQFANFDKMSYLGNPGLYGIPASELDNPTSPPSYPTEEDEGDEDTRIDMTDFFWCFTMSCITMFMVTLVILSINPHWRRAWFEFVDWHVLWWFPMPLM